MPDSTRSSTIIFLSLIAIFLYLQLFRFPATPFLFEGDHAVHLANAWRMFQGEAAYRDFFLFTFPATEFFYLFFFNIFGVKIWILNAVIFFLLLSLSAVGLFFSRRILSGWVVYLPVSIFIIIGFRLSGIDGSHRFFSVLFVLIAAAVLFCRRTPARLFLAGAFCGIASCFTQPRGLVVILAITFFLLIEKFYTKQNLSACVRSIFSVVLPYILIIGFVSIYFITTAGFDNFYFATFVFPFKHYPADVWNNPHAFLRDIPSLREISPSLFLRQAAPLLFNYFLIPWIYLLFFVVLRFKRQIINDEKKLQLIFINLVGLFLAAGTFSSPSSARFYQISLPGLISLIWLIQFFFDFPKIIMSFLAVLGLLGVFYTVQRQRIPITMLDTPSGSAASLSPEVLSRYQWVAEHTQPNDYFYEPHHPSLYMIFQLKNPTPFTLIRPNNYTTAEQIADVIGGLQRNPPRYIIWNGVWETYNSNNSTDFHLEPLINFLRTNYHQVEELNKFVGADNKIEYQAEVWEIN